MTNGNVRTTRPRLKPAKMKVPIGFRPTQKQFNMLSKIQRKLKVKTRTETLERVIELAASELGIRG